MSHDYVLEFDVPESSVPVLGVPGSSFPGLSVPKLWKLVLYILGFLVDLRVGRISQAPFV